MKPKRIKAVKVESNFGTFNDIWEGHSKAVGYEPCYLIRQSDVRALAEQFVRSSAEFYRDKVGAATIDPRSMEAALYALKRAGITPGRARKGKQ